MKRGTVVWFDVKKGFGFIESEGTEYFVHFSKILGPPGEFRLLEENDVVDFESMKVDRGDGTSKWQAKDVTVIKET